jgi:hypothetical protein
MLLTNEIGLDRYPEAMQKSLMGITGRAGWLSHLRQRQRWRKNQ